MICIFDFAITVYLTLYLQTLTLHQQKKHGVRIIFSLVRFVCQYCDRLIYSPPNLLTALPSTAWLHQKSQAILVGHEPTGTVQTNDAGEEDLAYGGPCGAVGRIGVCLESDPCQIRGKLKCIAIICFGCTISPHSVHVLERLFSFANSPLCE